MLCRVHLTYDGDKLRGMMSSGAGGSLTSGLLLLGFSKLTKY